MEVVALAKLIEELAANAWPAPVQQQIEGWRLRAGFGASRRANSVMCIGPAPQSVDWVGEISNFYRRWNLPARFQISDASPEGLDDMLEERGCIIEASTLVMGAPCRDVLNRIESAANCEMVFYDRLEPEWFEAFMSIEGYPEAKRRGYEEIMSRIGPLCLFSLARIGGEPAGIGLAVLERGWAGLFNIATHPGHRRGGIGTQTMRALTTWAAQNGAANLYLQVLVNNEAAIKLYEKLGFGPLYRYHFRSLEQ